ncbi:MAG: Ribonucleotide reductase transcriptional regulator NrdR, partial [uncultured Acidimicrobiales bacterium]
GGRPVPCGGALPVVLEPRRQGDRLPDGRRRWRHPPSAGVPGVRAAGHHVRAGGGGVARGGEALGGARPVRPVQGGGGRGCGRQEPPGDPAGDGVARSRRRGAGPPRGAGGHHRGARHQGPRAAAAARRCRLPALRERLQGLRGPHRLPAGGRGAGEGHRAEAARHRAL